MTETPVAIITGAGRGIGRATAQALSERGYQLVLVGRTETALRDVNTRIGGSAIIAVGDVSIPHEVSRIVSEAVAKFGRIDAVINNAGVAPVLNVEQTTPEEWKRVIETNLSAAFYVAHAVWAQMKRQRRGVIVNVSSYSARDPFPGFVAYGSAKAGLNLMGLALAREGEAHGIRVHTIAPAAVETEMFRRILTPEQHPVEKTLAPSDVAHVIVQCVTGELRHTSGEVIYLHKSP